MTPAAMLAEIRRRGAIAYRKGDTIRLRPASVLPPELIEAVRRHKAELLAVVPELHPGPRVDYEAIYAELTAAARTADDLAAIDRHARLNGLWVADEISCLDRRCDALARARADEPSYRAAVLLLIARVDELRCWHEGTPPARTSRRLLIERNTPLPAPLTLNDGTTIEYASRFIARLLTAVDYVLARRGLDAVLDVYLKQLATLGVVAVVDQVQ